MGVIRSLQEVKQLLQQAYTSRNQPRGPHGHPAIEVQYVLEHSIANPSLYREGKLAQTYADWMDRGDGRHIDQIAEEIYEIMSESGEGKQYCVQCGGFYLPHEH